MPCEAADARLVLLPGSARPRVAPVNIIAGPGSCRMAPSALMLMGSPPAMLGDAALMCAAVCMLGESMELTTAIRLRSKSREPRRWPGVLRPPAATPLMVGLLLALRPHASTLGMSSMTSRSSSSIGIVAPAYACTRPEVGLAMGCTT